jgi:hypothetical protein
VPLRRRRETVKYPHEHEANKTNNLIRGEKLTGAVKLDRGKAELLGNLGVLDRAGILEGHATDTLGHVRGRSDGRATAKSLELDVDNLSGLLVDLDLELHDITTGGCADETGTDEGIGLVEGSDVAGTLIVVNDLVDCIRGICVSVGLNWCYFKERGV